MKKLNLNSSSIICEYNSGISIEKLATKLDISTTTIANLLKKNNITIRKHSYVRKKFNEYYFDNIDSKEKAYWLGFLNADGYNNEKIHRVCFTLHQKDKCMLELFSKHIDFEGPVNSYTYPEKTGRSPFSTVGLTSLHFSKKLSEIGIFQRKSLVTVFPPNEIVPLNLKWHFFRGLMDGDGCVHMDGRRFSVTGGFELCNGILKFWNENDITGGYISHWKRSECKAVTISNFNDYIKLGHLIYRESEGLRMERKFNNYKAHVLKSIKSWWETFLFMNKYKAFDYLDLNSKQEVFKQINETFK